MHRRTSNSARNWTRLLPKIGCYAARSTVGKTVEPNRKVLQIGQRRGAQHPTGPSLDGWFREASSRTLTSTAAPIISIDTWFREVGPKAAPSVNAASTVDDYFRNSTIGAVSSPQSPVAVDDYFRAPALVPASGSGFDWGDAGIGAASGFGLALGLAGLGLVVLRRRMGEMKTGTAATVPS